MRKTGLLLMTAVLLSGCQKKVAEQHTPAPDTTVSTSAAPADADLIRINGRGFTQADVDFAGVMLQLQVLSQQATPEEKEAAIKRLENVNIRLNHIIERYAMSLLGEEKHYAIPGEQVTAEREKLQSQIDVRPEMRALIDNYGAEKFGGRIDEYLRQQLVQRRVIEELLADQKREQPKATAKELDYATAQAYDALFQDHMDDLDVQINLKGLPPRTDMAKPTQSAVPAPELKVLDAHGKRLTLPQPSAEKPVLINFWATWCGPCREELPLLLAAKAAGKYEVLLVNVDETPQKVQTFLQEQQLETLPVAYAKTEDLKGWTMPGLPTSYLIGPNWTTLDKHFGPLKAGEGWLSGI